MLKVSQCEDLNKSCQLASSTSIAYIMQQLS